MGWRYPGVGDDLAASELQFSPSPTGFHVAHVTAVILKTILVGIQSRLADFRQSRRLVVQSHGIYWHFVAVIWIP